MMDFFGPGVEAAARIGLYPRLAAVAYHVEAAEYVDKAGRPTSRLDYDQFARLAGGKVLSLLRPDMERAAHAALEDVPHGRVHVRYGARVSQVWRDDDGVRVAVDGSPGVTLAADVLVGADGIHSVVRSQVFGPEEEYLRPLGMRAAAFIMTNRSLMPASGTGSSSPTASTGWQRYTASAQTRWRHSSKLSAVLGISASAAFRGDAGRRLSGRCGSGHVRNSQRRTSRARRSARRRNRTPRVGPHRARGAGSRQRCSPGRRG